MDIAKRLESLPMTPMMRKILFLVGIGWLFDAMGQGMLAGVLDRLVRDSDEAQASALSPMRYREMVSVYEDYARRHGHAPDA